MNDALAIAATGMHAHQLQVESIANNLANINTPAFKRSRLTFTDAVVRARLADAAGLLDAEPTRAAGVSLGGTGRLFEPGELKRTDGPMDVAVQGHGFLELAMPDGSRAYSRGGTLRINDSGLLANDGGIALKPGLHVPPGAQAIMVSSTGRVQARLPGQSSPIEVGQLELVRFADTSGLLAEGANLYRATEASGEPIGGRPGEDGLGTLAQGFVESSNVKLVEEMVQLVVAQRAYEASMKVMQAADDMLGMVNGLRR